MCEREIERLLKMYERQSKLDEWVEKKKQNRKEVKR
jgi:hypothetical protein